MPLDSQTYLRNNGWQGHGTALREGALSRPLSIPQKRTLAGVGKDRDEAFPFWDHVFAAASSAIQIKVGSDDEASDSESTPRPELRRTTTGILSNKRPPTGTPASSHDPSPAPTHPLSVMALAKRTAARKNLYSRFFKGPVLGPDATEQEMVQTENMSMEEKVHAGHEDMRDALEHAHVVHQVDDGESKKKRKREDGGGDGGERKRSKEEKEKRRAEKALRRAEKEARRAAKASTSTAVSSYTPTSTTSSKTASAEPDATTAEDDAKPAKRRAKEKRRKARAEGGEPDEKEKMRAEKEERRARKLAKETEKQSLKSGEDGDSTMVPAPAPAEDSEKAERRKKRRREAVGEEILEGKRTKKSKRRKEDTA